MNATMPTNQTTAAAKVATPDENEDKYLTFSLENEGYGVEILRVCEIIGLIDITPLPRTPPYVKGVINLRGAIIPVIDLRARFSMPAQEYTEETCVIVVEVIDTALDEMFQVGAIVDRVSEVLRIPKEQVEPAPSFSGSLNTDFIMGMGKLDNAVLILLDVDRVLAEVDADELLELAADPEPPADTEPELLEQPPAQAQAA